MTATRDDHPEVRLGLRIMTLLHRQHKSVYALAKQAGVPVHTVQRIVRLRGLLLHHVEPGAGQFLLLQRADQVGLDVRRPAPGVDEIRGWLHVAEQGVGRPAERCCPYGGRI